jgi:TolB-like protein
MRRIFFFSALVISILLPFLPVHADDTLTKKSITVAGFINNGDKSDGNMNLLLSKSIITFLSKLPGYTVVPFVKSFKAAQDRGFLAKKRLDPKDALDIGLATGSKQVITGDYKIDKKKNRIAINMLVYDVVSGELTLKRKFEGEADISVFDSIDQATSDLASLIVGHTITMGQMTVTINGTEKTYTLYINGTPVKQVSIAEPFSDKVPAGQEILVSLRVSGSADNVYSKSVTLTENKTFDITYSPSATMIVDTGGITGAELFIDDAPSGSPEKNGTITLTGVKPDEMHTLVLKKNGTMIAKQKLMLREAETATVFLKKDLFSFPVRLLSGGLGAMAGVDFTPFNFLRFNVSGGAVYMLNSIFPTLSASACVDVVEFSDFTVRASLGVYIYFSAQVVFWPELLAEFDWQRFFVEVGARYSYVDGNFYPMIGLGYRF